MLFQDDQKIQAPKNVRDKFKKRATFTLTPNRTPIDPNTGKPSIPRSYSIVPFYTIYDKDEGTHITIRYADGVSLDKDRKNVYYPNEITFPQSGLVFVPPNNPDLYYFLLNHPQCKTNPDRDTSKAVIFELEDQVADAAKMIDAQKMKAMVENKIYFTWTSGELREICKSFQIADVSQLSDDQMRLALVNRMRGNPAAFLELAQSEEMGTRARMQEAVDKKIIHYDASSTSWHYYDEKGQSGKKIVAVRPGEDSMNRLISFLETDKNDQMAYILSLLIEEPKKKVAV